MHRFVVCPRAHLGHRELVGAPPAGLKNSASEQNEYDEAEGGDPVEVKNVDPEVTHQTPWVQQVHLHEASPEEVCKGLDTCRPEQLQVAQDALRLRVVPERVGGQRTRGCDLKTNGDLEVRVEEEQREWREEEEGDAGG